MKRKIASRLLSFLVFWVILIQEEAFAQETPLNYIAIRESDVKNLGGWPLDRKWYAIALENLFANGADRIFIDLAFSDADISHPESDRLFFETLLGFPKAFLLTAPDDFAADSIKVLGNFSLPAKRFFAPFAASFQLKRNRLISKDDAQGSFAKRLLEKSQTGGRLVAFPESAPASKLSFVEVVKNKIQNIDGDVVVGLELPGRSSYIAGSETRDLVSSTALQVWAVRQIRAGEFGFYWSSWRIFAVFCLSLLPALGAFFFRKKAFFFLFAVVAVIVIFAALNFARIYVSPLWLLLVLIPLGAMLWQISKNRTTINSAFAASNDQEKKQTAPSQNKEVRELRERLQFYEHLTSHDAPLPKPEANGLYFHPKSPLVGVLQKAKQIAEAKTSVLILGESGVGKERIAQFIHENSIVAEGPFVAVNCAAFNENLIESELFGYEPGAFTGATKQKPGRFELADGGTLFLDEIAETSPAFQAKLLRVLQEGAFERVGGVQQIRVSVRIVAATHHDLEQEVAEKKFREDLYYRLAGYLLTVPPLRERPMDAATLFKAFAAEADKKIKLSDSIASWVGQQKWPGNVRELRSATERAILNASLKKRHFLLPEDFELSAPVTTPETPKDDLATQILVKLREHQFRHRSVSETARDLGIHRVTVTEYQRGLIAKFYAEQNLEVEKTLAAIRGDATIADEAQFKKRISGYIASLHQKIEDGVKTGESDVEIRLQRFKSLPGYFETAFDHLIKQIRTLT